MTLSEFLHSEFPLHLPHTAFFLGNGLNNYCGTTSSWLKLLVDLADKHVGHGTDYRAMLQDHSISYPEFFDMLQLASTEEQNNLDYSFLKGDVREGFLQWAPTALHTAWAELLIGLNRPVLTTNFDPLLERAHPALHDFVISQQRSKRQFRPLRMQRSTDKGFSSVYPWHSYYAPHVLRQPRHEFALWHIHGYCEYKNSIRLSLSDYMGIVENARIWLHRSVGNPFYQASKKASWIGNNSWLDIFLDSHLLFLGFDLGNQETSMRWLLIEREKYFRRFPALRRQTWYVWVKGEDALSQGKRLFFEKLSIRLVEASSYRAIYEGIPGQLAPKNKNAPDQKKSLLL